jgi:hypothetical protein
MYCVDTALVVLSQGTGWLNIFDPWNMLLNLWHFEVFKLN